MIGNIFLQGKMTSKRESSNSVSLLAGCTHPTLRKNQGRQYHTSTGCGRKTYCISQ